MTPSDTEEMATDENSDSQDPTKGTDAAPRSLAIRDQALRAVATLCLVSSVFIAILSIAILTTTLPKVNRLLDNASYVLSDLRSKWSRERTDRLRQEGAEARARERETLRQLRHEGLSRALEELKDDTFRALPDPSSSRDE